jgi:hypothetical protein
VRGSIRLVLALFLAVPLAAQAVGKFDPERGTRAKDLRQYDRVAVEPLIDAVPFKNRDPAVEAKIRKTIADAGVAFADSLVRRLAETGKFEAVGRAPTEGATLLIGGQVVKYDPGNAIARYSGVFGRSRFGARIELKDAASGKLLGHIDVDVASSLIPGAVNVIQSVGQFMEGSAIRVRDEILIARGDLHREQTGRQGRLREKYGR